MLTVKDIHRETILAMAEHDMNVIAVANEMHYHRNTMYYRLEQINKDYGLNPRRFYDLVKLVEMAKDEDKENEA